MKWRKIFLLIIVWFLLPFIIDILLIEIKIFQLHTVLYKLIIALVIIVSGNILVWNSLNKTLKRSDRKYQMRKKLEKHMTLN